MYHYGNGKAGRGNRGRGESSIGREWTKGHGKGRGECIGGRWEWEGGEVGVGWRVVTGLEGGGGGGDEGV